GREERRVDQRGPRERQAGGSEVGPGPDSCWPPRGGDSLLTTPIRRGEGVRAFAPARSTPQLVVLNALRGGVIQVAARLSAGWGRRILPGDAENRRQLWLAAEVRTHKQWPLAWLKKGPGKETLETPGSTQPVPRPFIAEANQQINLLMTPEMQG